MSAKSMKILVTDDCESMRRFMGAYLARLGHTVLECESAEEGLELFQREKGIELVIADVEMPGMNGLEMLLTLRTTDKETRFWLVSGTVTTDMHDRSRAGGAERLLYKPDMLKAFRELGSLEIAA